jgi:phosphatidylinositol alpha-mannosyltransferase
MPLRIGIFAPYDLARTGGVNNQIRSQARALRRLGHDVSVYGPASGPLADGEVALCRTFSIHVSGTESSLGIDPTSLFRVSEVLSSNRFDVVHVHEPLTPLMPWFVLARAQAPIVGTFHVHREHGHPFYPIGRPFLALLMRRLSYRIAVSEAARQTIARYFPGDYDIVPNGIDADEFRRPQARPQLVASDRRHVLYVGRLEPRKGADHLIRAMATCSVGCRRS